MGDLGYLRRWQAPKVTLVMLCVAVTKDGLPGYLTREAAQTMAGAQVANLKESPALKAVQHERYMLKRTSSHVVEGECCKVQVALGIDSRASTYAKIYGMW